jgi:hypothetical protein
VHEVLHATSWGSWWFALLVVLLQYLEQSPHEPIVSINSSGTPFGSVIDWIQFANPSAA